MYSKKIFVHFLLGIMVFLFNIGAIFFLSMFPGYSIESLRTVVVAAIILSFLRSYIVPIVLLMGNVARTPRFQTILFGMVAFFFLDVLMFALTIWLTEGFEVTSSFAIFGGALILISFSFIQGIIAVLLFNPNT